MSDGTEAPASIENSRVEHPRRVCHRLKLRRQQTPSAARQNELRRGMPFSRIFRTRDLMAFRRRHSGDPDSLIGPAHDASQNPVHDANNQNDFVLRARKIPKEYVHQRDRADDHAEQKPPDNPAVNTNVDVIHKHGPL